MVVKKRSLGVTVFGALSMFLGGSMLWGFVSEFMILYLLDAFVVMRALAAIGFIISGLFIFQLHNWARLLFLFLMGLNVYTALHGVYFGTPVAVIPGKEGLYVPMFFLIALLPFCITLYFFTRPSVRAQFLR